MKKLIVAITLLLLCGCSSVDKTLLASSTTLLVADWGQTRDIALNPNKFQESNLILGKHPHVDKVDIYFASVLFINTSAYFVLPDNWRTAWLAGVTLVEAGCVINNASQGIKINFRF